MEVFFGNHTGQLLIQWFEDGIFLRTANRVSIFCSLFMDSSMFFVTIFSTLRVSWLKRRGGEYKPTAPGAQPLFVLHRPKGDMQIPSNFTNSWGFASFVSFVVDLPSGVDPYFKNDGLYADVLQRLSFFIDSGLVTIWSTGRTGDPMNTLQAVLLSTEIHLWMHRYMWCWPHFCFGSVS